MTNIAEQEFMKRLQICAQRANIDLKIADWSSEIIASEPDFVLSMHEFSPKLTAIPTVGAMWNPPRDTTPDPLRCEYLRSYDGYLAASASIEALIEEQSASLIGPQKPIADFRFYPTSPARIAQAESHDSIAYIGVHWDGDRHGDLMRALAATRSATFYGPEAAWRFAGSSYNGSIPFDGTSVIRTLANHGIVLCLHRDHHILDDTPSMRLFEAASAGCLIISDALPFAKRTFGDSIFVLPEGEGRPGFIQQTLAWARANPLKARDMARASQTIFEHTCSLDVLVPKVVDFGQSVARTYRKRRSGARITFKPPRVDVFVIAGKGSANELLKTISMVRAQRGIALRLLVVCDDDCEKHLRSAGMVNGRNIKTLRLEEAANTADLAWYVRGDFVAFVHTDEVWEPYHLEVLVDALSGAADANCVRALSVQILEAGKYISAPNLNGYAGNKVLEDRALFRAVGNPLQPREPADLLKWACCSGLLWRAPAWLKSLEAFGTEHPPSAGLAADVPETGWVTMFRTQVAAEEIAPIVFR